MMLIDQLRDMHTTPVRRSVALGVAAAVAWTAKTDKVSSPAANDTLSCLFRADSPDISGLLVVAERCIGEESGVQRRVVFSRTPSFCMRRCVGMRALMDCMLSRYFAI